MECNELLVRLFSGMVLGSFYRFGLLICCITLRGLIKIIGYRIIMKELRRIGIIFRHLRGLISRVSRSLCRGGLKVLENGICIAVLWL